jgi:hypothetical protein
MLNIQVCLDRVLYTVLCTGTTIFDNAFLRKETKCNRKHLVGETPKITAPSFSLLSPFIRGERGELQVCLNETMVDQ